MTKARTKHLRWLWENREPLRASRVDREKGVIHGVKVLGFNSANGRRYLPEAVKNAIRLYEGRKVKCNHPARANQSRDVRDTFGWLEGCEIREDGLYADLHILNPRTDLAESVMNAAELKPDLYGLSHNAQGDVERQGGIDVVREITEVRSVDLVDEPATTNGLFEDKRGKPMKLKALLEAIKLSKPRRRLVNRLLEDDTLPGEMDLPAEVEAPAEDAPAGDHTQALMDGFQGAIMSLVQSCLGGEMDCKEASKKIAEMLKTHGKLSSSDAPSEPVEEEEEEDLEECDEGEDMKEELRRLKAKNAARDLCEELDVKPGKALLAALVALPDDKARRELLEETRAAGPATAGSGNRPRTAPRGGAQSVSLGSTKDITSGKGLAQALREGRFSGH